MKLATLEVLIIDDFQNMRSMLRQMLLSLGFQQIAQAASAKDGLETLRKRRFDLVLCDYNLGEGLDGQQLLDQGRAEGVIDLATAFVMVTAENSNEMVMGALESVPDAYLAKPVSKDLLRARLMRALQRRAPFSEIARALRKGPEVAIACIDRQLAQDTDGRLDLLRVKADLALSLGQVEQVEQAAREALADRPLAWAVTRLGDVVQAQQGDSDATEALYRRSIALTPQFMEAHDRLIALLEAQGRTEEALELLHQASERSPKSLARQRRLGELALSLGRADLAAPALKRVLSLTQQLGESRAGDYYRAILAQQRLGDARQVRRLLGSLPKVCKNDPELPWWLLAARLCTQGESEDTRATLLADLDARCAEHQPPEAARAALAEVLTALGEQEHAQSLAARPEA